MENGAWGRGVKTCVGVIYGDGRTAAPPIR